jgi:hypothetical protein
MSLRKEVDISKTLDTAETRGVSGDPITRKPRITLQGGKEKYDGSQKKVVQVLAALTRIGECLMEVSPTGEDVQAEAKAAYQIATTAHARVVVHQPDVRTGHRRHSVR